MPEMKQRKKRQAPYQSGPPPKKINFAEQASEKKRSQPVTSRFPIVEDSESDEEQDEEDVPMDSAVDEDITMQEAPLVPKDPNASREAHKAQRILTDQRKAAKPNSALLIDAKRQWSLARQKTLPPDERRKQISALMSILRGRVSDIVFKHDASRIVQTGVKWGTQSERDEIAAELKGRYKELAQSKYSKFLVTKLIRLCPSHRAGIILEFQGSVLRLLLHREATSVLADSFELYGNAYERALLIRDFYGRETALFTTTQGTAEDKERVKKGLSGVLEGSDDERRKRVLNAVKENILQILNNSDKGAVTHAIVHRAIWEYLQAIQELSDESERESLYRELFENCQEILAEMVHTKDGSRVVREFIARGSAKDRKQIVKVIKPHIVRMCGDDEAQQVLFASLDIIDDTKLTGKSVVPDITGAALALSATPQGRRSLFYLINPRNTRHFPPALIASIASTDSIRAKTSKKAPDIRSDEIRKAASDKLISFIEDSGESLIRDPGGSLVVLEVMLFADGETRAKTASIETILRAISAPYPSEDEDAHPIDLPHVSRMIKTLLQGGPFSHTSKTVTKSPYFSAAEFARSFISHVGKETTLAMANGEGAFVVAELIERILQEGDETSRSTIRGWLDGDALARIAAGDAKGRNVLMEKIQLL